MNIFIDIETIPGPNKPLPEDIKAPANYKDPAKIAAYQLEAVDDAWRKQALHPLRGRIVCVAMAIDDEPVGGLASDNEQELIAFIYRGTSRSDFPTWIGHNIAAFDLVWIRNRAIKYGYKELSRMIDFGRFNGNYIDTMREVGGWRDMYSLADCCDFYGIPRSTTTGAQVCDWWQAGEGDWILQHCVEDVEAVRSLYSRICL